MCFFKNIFPHEQSELLNREQKSIFCEMQNCICILFICHFQILGVRLNVHCQPFPLLKLTLHHMLSLSGIHTSLFGDEDE